MPKFQLLPIRWGIAGIMARHQYSFVAPPTTPWASFILAGSFWRSIWFACPVKLPLDAACRSWPIPNPSNLSLATRYWIYPCLADIPLVLGDCNFSYLERDWRGWREIPMSWWWNTLSGPWQHLRAAGPRWRKYKHVRDVGWSVTWLFFCQGLIDKRLMY